MELKKYATKLLPAWTKEVPFQIKGIAIKEATAAFWVAKGRPKFRTRKKPLQSCFIPKTSISSIGIYPRISGKGLIFKENLPDSLCDSRLIWRNGNWFLGACHKETISRSENQASDIVALDPGVRTFISFYSPSYSGNIGIDISEKIFNYFYSLDNLYSKIAKSKNAKKKRSYRKAAMRTRERINNLITDLHYRTANFLCDNFKIIILPIFKTKDMAGKLKRKIKSKTVRAMLGLSFYKFRQRLEWVALKKNRTIVLNTEEYTSKTHPQTGVINKQLGSAKTIKLLDGSRANRDTIGAFNFLVKTLVVDTPAYLGATYNYL